MPYRPRVGDTRWIVEWLVAVGQSEDGDRNRDLDIMRTRSAKDRDEAVSLAKEMLPLSVDAQVCFWPVEFVAYDEADADRHPYVGFWEDAGDAEYLMADDE